MLATTVAPGCSAAAVAEGAVNLRAGRDSCGPGAGVEGDSTEAREVVVAGASSAVAAVDKDGTKSGMVAVAWSLPLV